MNAGVHGHVVHEAGHAGSTTHDILDVALQGNGVRVGVRVRVGVKVGVRVRVGVSEACQSQRSPSHDLIALGSGLGLRFGAEVGAGLGLGWRGSLGLG